MVYTQITRGVLNGIDFQFGTRASNGDANFLEFAWELDL